jgi:hypothetical protein
VIGGLLGRVAPAPESLRRNLVVSGINLLALKGMRVRIGQAVLEGASVIPARGWKRPWARAVTTPCTATAA